MLGFSLVTQLLGARSLYTRRVAFSPLFFSITYPRGIIYALDNTAAILRQVIQVSNLGLLKYQMNLSAIVESLMAALEGIIDPFTAIHISHRRSIVLGPMDSLQHISQRNHVLPH